MPPASPPELSPQEAEEQWQSVGDLMSGLIAVFVLCLLVVMLRMGEKVRATEEAHAQANASVARAQRAESALRVAREDGVVLARTHEEMLMAMERVADAVGRDLITVDAGEMVLRESLLFDKDRWDLKPAGRRLLGAVFPQLAEKLLANPETRRLVKRIVIEGHASREGDPIANQYLSMLRAHSVARFALDDAPRTRSQRALLEVLVPSGRGVADARPFVDPGDRRVVIRIETDNAAYKTQLEKLLRATQAPENP